MSALQECLDSYKNELVNDAIVHTHLTALYGTLLEQNLVRLIEPFSRVEIPHIAHLINLPVDVVEQKLSQASALHTAVVGAVGALPADFGMLIVVECVSLCLPSCCCLVSFAGFPYVVLCCMLAKQPTAGSHIRIPYPAVSCRGSYSCDMLAT